MLKSKKAVLTFLKCLGLQMLPQEEFKLG